MKPLVGIYSRPNDHHLERVTDELKRRSISWLCFDSMDFPQHIQLAASFDTKVRGWRGDFVHDGKTYRLEDFYGIWYRRPTRRYDFPLGMSEEEREYARAEAREGFDGILRSLPHCLWVSDPTAIRQADYKPKQLVYAQKVGLLVPKTLITNDPWAARVFFEEECQGQMVYKSFTQPEPKVGRIWEGAIYTSKVTRSSLQEHLSAIRLTANLFQQYIPKAFELRITVIGANVFAAEIHSQHSERAKVDFRAAYQDLHYQVHTLPKQIEEACRQLVRSFHLQFSAIDMLVTPQGQYYFLESNANGQWGWIERHTGLPLTTTLVDLLVHGREETIGSEHTTTTLSATSS